MQKRLLSLAAAERRGPVTLVRRTPDLVLVDDELREEEKARLASKEG